MTGGYGDGLARSAYESSDRESGKFRRDGANRRDQEKQSFPMASVGQRILAFGWFG